MEIRPRVLSHILDSESKSVTFGWALSIAAHAFFVLLPSRFTVEHWTAAQAVAAGLVAAKTAKEAYLEGKEGKSDPASAPPAA